MAFTHITEFYVPLFLLILVASGWWYFSSSHCGRSSIEASYQERAFLWVPWPDISTNKYCKHVWVLSGKYFLALVFMPCSGF